MVVMTLLPLLFSTVAAIVVEVMCIRTERLSLVCLRLPPSVR